MKQLMHLFKKDLFSYFSSYVAYFTIFLYLLLSVTFAVYFGGIFVNIDVSLYSFFNYQPGIFMMIIPCLFMRSVAEEKKTGVYELTMTYPTSYMKIVLSKFFSSYAMSLIMLLLTIPFIVYFSMIKNVDIGIIVTSYIGVSFAVALFCAISFLIFTMFDNAILAYLTSVIFMWIAISVDFDWVLIPISYISQSLYIKIQGGMNFYKHFYAYLAGHFSIASVLYFVISTTITIYFAKCALEVKKSQKNIRIIGYAILFVLLIAVLNFVVLSAFAERKIDFSSDHRYTLTKATKEIISSLETKVEIKIYKSKNLGKKNVAYSRYEAFVLDIVEKYKVLSNGNVTFEIRTPEKFNVAEVEAKNFGIESFLSNDKSEMLYFGAIVSDNKGNSNIISTFSVEREDRLELDITRAIYELFHKRKTIGWANAIENNQSDSLLQKYVQEYYNVVKIPSMVIEFPYDEIDALWVSNFNEISPMFAYALDQYILNGGKTMLFVNSTSLYDNPYPKIVLENIGIDYVYDMIVTDEKLGMDILAQDEKGFKKYIKDVLSLNIGLDNISSDSQITRGIKNLSLNNSSYINISEDLRDGIEILPLAFTTNSSGLVDINMVKNLSNIYLTHNYIEYNKKQPLIIYSKGRTYSMFGSSVLSVVKNESDYRPYTGVSVEDFGAVVFSTSNLFDLNSWEISRDLFDRYSLIDKNDNLKLVINSLDALLGNNILLDVYNPISISNRYSIYEELEKEKMRDYIEFVTKTKESLADKELELYVLKSDNKDVFTMENLKKTQILQQEIYQLEDDIKLIDSKAKVSVQSSLRKIYLIFIILVPLVEMLGIFLAISFYSYCRRRKILEIIKNEA